eukprot:XP_001704479.1 Hypothetical protein GL50803_31454 [Giardia lamblia ATCC 50803]
MGGLEGAEHLEVDAAIGHGLGLELLLHGGHEAGRADEEVVRIGVVCLQLGEFRDTVKVDAPGEVVILALSVRRPDLAQKGHDAQAWQSRLSDRVNLFLEGADAAVVRGMDPEDGAGRLLALLLREEPEHRQQRGLADAAGDEHNRHRLLCRKVDGPALQHLELLRGLCVRRGLLIGLEIPEEEVPVRRRDLEQIASAHVIMEIAGNSPLFVPVHRDLVVRAIRRRNN